MVVAEVFLTPGRMPALKQRFWTFGDSPDERFLFSWIGDDEHVPPPFYLRMSTCSWSTGIDTKRKLATCLSSWAIVWESHTVQLSQNPRAPKRSKKNGNHKIFYLSFCVVSGVSTDVGRHSKMAANQLTYVIHRWLIQKTGNEMKKTQIFRPSFRLLSAAFGLVLVSTMVLDDGRIALAQDISESGLKESTSLFSEAKVPKRK